MTDHDPDLLRVGVIDLGSNTIRLVVYECIPGQRYRLVDSIREQARLAEGMGATGRLQPAAIARSLAAIELFADYSQAASLDSLQVIATSAVRDAENGPELVQRIAQLGLDIEVLSGEEEANLGVSAVANGLVVEDAWVFDQGGGSLQLSEMSGRAWRSGHAYPLGALRLAERHPGLNRFSGDRLRVHVEKLEDEIASHLAPLARSMRRDPRPLIAIGGTVRNLAKIAQRQDRYPLDLLHGYRLERRKLEDLVDQLSTKTLARRRAMPGLNPERADLILPGALVYRWLLRASEASGIVVSGHGVREGAFYRRFLDTPHLLDDVRAFSVSNLFEHFPQPRLHTDQVRRLALQLFDGLAELHGYGAAERELLAAAALLHDIGMTIGYYGHHSHGSSLILSTPLHGFSHREHAILGLLVRFHRKGKPRPGALAPLLDEGDERRIAVLSLFLRLAEHLERSKSGRVLEVEPKITDTSILLRLHGRTIPIVEIWEAAKDGWLCESLFGRKLELAHIPAVVEA